MTLATDLAIRRWKPTKDGEAVGTGGRTGLYVRGWKTGTKAFYFRAKTWIKLGDYPDTTLAMARELSTVAKRLAREGFGVEALSRGFAKATTATDLEAVVRCEVLAGFADLGATRVPTYHELWTEWHEGRKHKLQDGPRRHRSTDFDICHQVTSDSRGPTPRDAGNRTTGRPRIPVSGSRRRTHRRVSGGDYDRAI